jgi:HEAT repeat protein
MRESNISALIVALSTDDRRSHTLVVDDLVRIGRSAVVPLVDALDELNPNVRSGAARALGKIGDLSALMPLIDCLRRDLNIEVRKSVVWALHMGGAQAVPALIDALSDEDEWVRFGAIIVLAKIGPAAVQPLMRTLQDPDPVLRSNAAETLGRIGDLTATDALAEALEDREMTVWEQAAISLGRMKDARAVYALMHMVDNPDSALRTKAIKALGQIGDIRAIDCLIDVIYNEADRHRDAARADDRLMTE